MGQGFLTQAGGPPLIRENRARRDARQSEAARREFSLLLADQQLSAQLGRSLQKGFSNIGRGIVQQAQFGQALEAQEASRDLAQDNLVARTKLQAEIHEKEELKEAEAIQLEADNLAKQEAEEENLRTQALLGVPFAIDMQRARELSKGKELTSEAIAQVKQIRARIRKVGQREDVKEGFERTFLLENLNNKEAAILGDADSYQARAIDVEIQRTQELIDGAATLTAPDGSVYKVWSDGQGGTKELQISAPRKEDESDPFAPANSKQRDSYLKLGIDIEKARVSNSETVIPFSIENAMENAAAIEQNRHPAEPELSPDGTVVTPTEAELAEAQRIRDENAAKQREAQERADARQALITGSQDERKSLFEKAAGVVSSLFESDEEIDDETVVAGINALSADQRTEYNGLKAALVEATSDKNQQQMLDISIQMAELVALGLKADKAKQRQEQLDRVPGGAFQDL